LVEPAEIVVKAEIIETDGFHQNGLLRVQTYLDTNEWACQAIRRTQTR
jgi:hypothetical protein